jgi:hypothetical protein
VALRQSTGKLTFLRVHDVGTKFGPPTDQLDVEVVAQLSTTGKRSFGFKLRDDPNRLTHAGMLDLLRDAFNHGWTVSIDHETPTGKQNGVIIRVALTK